MSRVLPVLGALFVTLGVPVAAKTSDRSPAGADTRPGVLLVAHGANREWNRQIKEVAEALRDRHPTEILFLMGDEKEPSAAVYNRLQKQGISAIVIVPLFVSSHSDHFEQVRFVAGQRDDYPHSEHMKLEQIPADLPVVLARALDDSQQLGVILLERAQVLSRKPAEETVLLVAHGPNSDEDAEIWTANLERVAEHVRDGGGFREVAVRLIRDDAPAEVRSRAVEQIRDFVRQRSTAGPVLAVPVLIARGQISEKKIPEILAGLDCRYNGSALLPHPAIAEWVEGSIPRAIPAGEVERVGEGSPSLAASEDQKPVP